MTHTPQLRELGGNAASDTAAALIDRLLSEGPIGTAEAARILGAYRGGRPMHPSTIARWALKGVVTPDGRRVRLEAARLSGAKLMTSRPALVRFLAAQQHEQLSPPPTTSRSPAERQRASDAAAKRLEDAGA